MIDKVKAWFKNSVTIAWARLLSVSGIAFEGIARAADVLQAGGIQVPLPPKYLGVYTAALGIITEIARRRSLPKD